MAQPFVGQLLLVGFNFTPAGWLACNGQLVPISEFETLFNLIGTTFGGDGQSTFGLPDLRGRVPVHMGSNGSSNYVLGQTGGVETVTLTINQMPQHTHTQIGSSVVQNSSDPAGNFLAVAGDHRYGPSSATPMAPGMISQVGGSQPHDNLQPYLALNWIISAFGIFPSQN